MRMKDDDTSTRPVGATNATLLSTKSGKNDVNAARMPPPCTRRHELVNDCDDSTEKVGTIETPAT